MTINAADTAWLLISAALVMLMTPALALFYGGMVRRKNLLSTMMMSFAIIAAFRHTLGTLRLQPDIRYRPRRYYRRI